MTKVAISETSLTHHRDQAEFKIDSEGWQGRNTEVKKENFFNCYVSEHAFSKILGAKRIKFQHRGSYIGPASGAGVDFTCWRDGREVTFGIRNINKDSIHKWKSVAYPDDRFRDEPDKIADYIVVCHHDKGEVEFFGMVERARFMELLGESNVLRSRLNQEKFRTVPLEEFSLSVMNDLLEILDKI